MNEIEDEDEIEDRSWRWNEPEHAREFLVDDLEGDTRIKLRIAGDKLRAGGEEDLAALFEATVDADGDWQLTQRFRYDKGAWLPDGQPIFGHRTDPSLTPKAEMRRRTIDGPRKRINTLLRWALQFDDDTHEKPRWRPVVSGRWRISEIRSGRGGKRVIDTDEAAKRLARGETLAGDRKTTEDLGYVNPRSIYNARHRQKRRSLDDDRES